METCVTSLQPQSLSAVLPRPTACSVNTVIGRWLFTRQLGSGSYVISDTRHLIISVHANTPIEDHIGLNRVAYIHSKQHTVNISSTNIGLYVVLQGSV